jgi:putative transposase
LISNIKGIKNVLKQQKELIVNTIEPLKDIIPINKALHVFNISRATYQNYKSIVIHKCEASYFKWCVKRHPNQLLIPEVDIIKKYMMHQDYKYWSKSSIYLKAIRDQKLSCGIATFYKYCRLLGFKNNTRKRKSDFYNPVRTNKPNELWCADVTIFKTKDNLKHYIHFLIDHFSKKILGYRIEKQNNPKAIKQLIQDAYFRYSPKKLQFLTDGGSENVNKTVSNFINSPSISIEHIIAQRDVAFSNSMIEATNKVIKHQFLFPKTIASRDELKPILYEAVNSYNSMRPQMSLAGNTPDEAFNGLSTDFSKYSSNFKEQKTVRRKLNKKNSCKKCS